MKKFGANLFLFSLLMGLLLMPLASLKLAKLNKQEVLSYESVQIDYLKQRIEKQEDEINRLKKLLKGTETKETTPSVINTNEDATSVE